MPTVDLAFPIKIGNEEKSSLNFRRMTVKDLRFAMNESNGGKDEMKFSVALTLRLNTDGIKPAELDAMDGGDWKMVQATIEELSDPPVRKTEEEATASAK